MPISQNPIVAVPFDENDLRDIAMAKQKLENPSIAARFSSALATPIERGMQMLPDGARKSILTVAEKSLDVALRAALLTLGEDTRQASNLAHKAGVAVSGGIGGAFGLAALSAELPISTTIMLRSIADIARSEGEDVKSGEARLACLEVFALGGPGDKDDAAESGYFGIRAALAATVSEAAAFAAGQGASGTSAPVLVRLIAQIASRFSIPVTEKAAAQAVPVIGAAGGALINTLFIDHFQGIARGHFTIRRLERSHGRDRVRERYADV